MRTHTFVHTHSYAHICTHTGTWPTIEALLGHWKQVSSAVWLLRLMYPMSRGQSYTIAWHVCDAVRSYLPAVGGVCVCVCVCARARACFTRP